MQISASYLKCSLGAKNFINCKKEIPFHDRRGIHSSDSPFLSRGRRKEKFPVEGQILVRRTLLQQMKAANKRTATREQFLPLLTPLAGYREKENQTFIKKVNPRPFLPRLQSLSFFVPSVYFTGDLFPWNQVWQFTYFSSLTASQWRCYFVTARVMNVS